MKLTCNNYFWHIICDNSVKRFIKVILVIFFRVLLEEITHQGGIQDFFLQSLDIVQLYCLFHLSFAQVLTPLCSLFQVLLFLVEVNECTQKMQPSEASTWPVLKEMPAAIDGKKPPNSEVIVFALMLFSAFVGIFWSAWPKTKLILADRCCHTFSVDGIHWDFAVLSDLILKTNC